MYSRVIINLKNLPKINKNKIISKELYELYNIQNKYKNTIIEKKHVNKTDIKYRSSPW